MYVAISGNKFVCLLISAEWLQCPYHEIPLCQWNEQCVDLSVQHCASYLLLLPVYLLSHLHFTNLKSFASVAIILIIWNIHTIVVHFLMAWIVLLREVSLFFNIVTIPVHTQMPVSDQLPPIEKKKRSILTTRIHNCLHLILRCAMVSFEVFLQFVGKRKKS